MLERVSVYHSTRLGAHDHLQTKGQQVVHDEVAADVGGAVLVRLIRTPEEADVVDLEDQDHDPVDAGDECVEAEGRSAVVVLSPDGVAAVVVAAVGGTREGVVDARHHHEEP